MSGFFRNMSFTRRITIVFTIVCILANSAMAILYYNYAKEKTIENLNEMSAERLSQLEDTLHVRTEAITMRAAAVLTNSSFSEPVVNYLNAPTVRNRVIAQGTISNFFKDIRLGDSLVSSIFIHTSHDDFDDFTKFRNRDFRFENSVFAETYKTDKDGSVRWFPLMEDEIFNNGGEVIPCVRRVKFTDTNEVVYLIIELSREELTGIIEGRKTSGTRLVFITDRNNRYITSSGQTERSTAENICLELKNLGSDAPGEEFTYDKNHYFVFQGEVPGSGWKIYILKPKSELLKSIGSIQQLIIGLTAMLILICWIVVSLTARQMTSSIKRLAMQMNRMRNGELDARFYYPYKDEIGSLSTNFNYMADEIQHYITDQKKYIETLQEERDQVTIIQKQKRKAELKALQAQINPHFLYNTLNSITWMAADKGETEISVLSSSLGKLFRISLSKGREIITIREEIEHVESYLKIQKIRYGDKIQYEISISGEILDLKMPKLLLQPLVENSIYHGIRQKSETGHIRIQARETVTEKDRKEIFFSVEDDGVGIPPEKLKAINAGLFRGITESGDSYGIYNVNERIRIYYGPDCGLSYESSENEFTRAVFNISRECPEEG